MMSVEAMLTGVFGFAWILLGFFFLSRITKISEETARHVLSIHEAVNSERETTLRLVKDLRDEILSISAENARLTERLISRRQGTERGPDPVAP